MNTQTIRPDVLNAAKIHSIKTGAKIQVGETTYKGMNAIYTEVNMKQIKVKAGIPFVRTSMKPHEIKHVGKYGLNNTA
jgi:hypothetical protein